MFRQVGFSTGVSLLRRFQRFALQLLRLCSGSRRFRLGMRHTRHRFHLRLCFSRLRACHPGLRLRLNELCPFLLVVLFQKRRFLRRRRSQRDGSRVEILALQLLQRNLACAVYRG